MKLRESIAVGALVAGASLGGATEGCVYSAYPQGKPGAVQPNRETVNETEALKAELVGFSLEDGGNALSDLEDPFHVICDETNGAANFVIDGQDVRDWCDRD